MPQEIDFSLTDDVDPDDYPDETFDAVCDLWRGLISDPDQDPLSVMLDMRQALAPSDVPKSQRADLVCDAMLVAFEEDIQQLRDSTYENLPAEWKDD